MLKNSKIYYFKNSNSKYSLNNLIKPNTYSVCKRKQYKTKMAFAQPVLVQQQLKRRLSDCVMDESSANDLLCLPGAGSNLMTNKRVKIDSKAMTPAMKNCIQQLYEIRCIQPIEFEMLSSEGPQHKPTFKFSLKFKYADHQLKFFGEGLNKKAAKTMSAMKAICFLIETKNPQFDTELFRALIGIDMKTLGLITIATKTNLDEFIQSILKQNITCEPIKNTETFHLPLKPAITIGMNSQHIFESQRPLNILEHLMSATSSAPLKTPIFTFERIEDESAEEEDKIKKPLNIKMKIRIEKALMKKVLTVVDLNKFEINEEITYDFIGEDVNETVAKAKAAQIALEKLFDIKLSSPVYEQSVNEHECTDLETKPDLTISDIVLSHVESLKPKQPISTLKQTTYDSKAREIIATKMPMNILNHLLTADYTFTLLRETGMSHSKLFKMELKIEKSVFSQSNVFTTVDLNNLKTNDSLLFTEDLTNYYFIGFGPNLKSAKSRAAQLALEFLFDIKIMPSELEFVSVESTHEMFDSEMKIKDFADNISELAKNKFDSLINTIESKSIAKCNNSLLANLSIIFEEEAANSKKLRNVYASITQTNGFDYNSSKLICVSTGTKCINGEFMSQMGTAINDCHAEILAVRLLRKYLYKQLNEFISQLNSNEASSSSFDSNIFELTGQHSDKSFRLKPQIKFHLFISSAPCGDGRIFSIHDNVTPNNHPNRKVRGLLRTKLESGEGTVPISDDVVQIQTWDGILIGERLKVMSCSDKLCKYNVVGVQGALLSHFVEPIYLSSLIIGSFYHKYHLSRALYGRVCESLGELPQGFKLNLPILSSITNNEQRKVSKSSNRSVIWSNELNRINECFEIINCREGKSINGTVSFVCKLELFKDWISVYKSLKSNINLSKKIAGINFTENNDSSNSFLYNYNHIKLLSKEYQLAKLKVYEAFRKASLGQWITKPWEQNYFSLSDDSIEQLVQNR